MPLRLELAAKTPVKARKGAIKEMVDQIGEAKFIDRLDLYEGMADVDISWWPENEKLRFEKTLAQDLKASASNATIKQRVDWFISRNLCLALGKKIARTRLSIEFAP